VTTLTDAALAAGRLTIDGTESIPMSEAGDVMERVAEMIAAGADRMKLAAHHVPLIAVGGGAFAVPDELPGISDIIRPKHGDVANAVGAALAQVSGEVDQVFRNLGRETAIATATEIATGRATESGADPASIEVIEVEDLPLAYLPGDARRVRVRVVGDLAR
jgi:N-methylhydantoinase A/oxoprolinase/acetone carboxylase beta subunit